MTNKYCMFKESVEIGGDMIRTFVGLKEKDYPIGYQFTLFDYEGFDTNNIIELEPKTRVCKQDKEARVV